ncbi:MAG: hypothetical protein ACKOFG_01015 [Limnohabitans sp.]
MTDKPDPRHGRPAWPKPRLTRAAWLWIVLYLGVPVLVLGGLLDALVWWFSGQCTGIWCWF